MFGLGAIQEFAHRATVYTKDIVASAFSARAAHVAGAGQHLEEGIPLRTFRVHREYSPPTEPLAKSTDTPISTATAAPVPMPVSSQKTSSYVDTARPKKGHAMSDGSLLRERMKPINPALPVPSRGGHADEVQLVVQPTTPAPRQRVWDLFKPVEKKKRAPRNDRGLPHAPPKAMKAKQSKSLTATVSKGTADDFRHLKKNASGSSEGQEQLWQEFFQQRRSADTSRASSVVDDADEPFNPNGWDDSLFENTRSSLS